MDNVQLYLVIGIPIVCNGIMFMALAGTINTRMTALEGRLAAMEKTLASFGTRLTRLEERNHQA